MDQVQIEKTIIFCAQAWCPYEEIPINMETIKNNNC